MKTLSLKGTAEIEEKAARWAARIDARTMTEADDALLSAWIALDRRHAGALLRAQAAMVTFDRLRVLAHGNSTGRLPSIVAAKPASILAERMRLAASSAAIVAMGVTLWLAQPRPANAYETARGEIRSLPFASRATVVMDSISAITFDTSEQLPSIEIDHGRAIVDSTADPGRPLMLIVGDCKVTVAGAELSVRREDESTGSSATILVRRGRAGVQVAGDPSPIVIAAGEQLELRADRKPRRRTVDTDTLRRSFVWREGSIDVHGMRLDQAAREFARYSDYRIVVDPAVAGRRVTGLFSVGEPRAFARAVALSLDLTVDLDRDRARLRR
jgi:transmembrane sensor